MGLISKLFVLLIICCSCLATHKAKDDESAKFDQLQLQEEIQRFYTRFTERLAEAILQNEKLSTTHRLRTIQEYTLYDSEALKITTSPYPEINLLDMLVFVKLNRAVIKRYWIPHYYGKAGKPLLDAFAASERDINDITLRVLGPQKVRTVDEGVKKWLSENPEAFRVEKIRVGAFSKYARVQDDDKGFSLSFVDTKSAVKAVDQMVLVANRGIFLAQSMPFIMRLHTRLGVSEVIQDAMVGFDQSGDLIQKMEETTPLIENMTDLTTRLEHLSANTLKIVQEMNKHPKRYQVMDTLTKSESLLDKTNLLIQQLNRHELEGIMWTAALLLILVGVIISAAWWTGYYISRKMLK